MTSNISPNAYVYRQWFNPLWLVVPASVIVFALGWRNVGGATGALVGGVVGLIWALILGYIVSRINRTKKWQGWLATAAALATGVILFVMMGGGLFEYMLISKALDTSPEWIATITSGPLAQQVIIYFVIFNSLLEIVLVPLTIFLNWHIPKRRGFVLSGALIFYALRIWTYLYFAPQYIEFGSTVWSQALLDQLTTRMTIENLRFALQTAEAVLFFLAALIPVSSVLARAADDR